MLIKRFIVIANILNSNLQTIARFGNVIRPEWFFCVIDNKTAVSLADVSVKFDKFPIKTCFNNSERALTGLHQNHHLSLCHEHMSFDTHVSEISSN